MELPPNAESLEIQMSGQRFSGSHPNTLGSPIVGSPAPVGRITVAPPCKLFSIGSSSNTPMIGGNVYPMKRRSVNEAFIEEPSNKKLALGALADPSVSQRIYEPSAQLSSELPTMGPSYFDLPSLGPSCSGLSSIGPSTSGLSSVGPSSSGLSSVGPSNQDLPSIGPPNSQLPYVGASSTVLPYVGPSYTGPSTSGQAFIGPSYSGPSTSELASMRPSISGLATMGPSTSGLASMEPSTSALASMRTSNSGQASMGTSTSGQASMGTTTSGLASMGTTISGLASMGTSTLTLASMGTSTSGLASMGTSISGLASMGTSTSGLACMGTSTSVQATMGPSTSGLASIGSSTSGITYIGAPYPQPPYAVPYTPKPFPIGTTYMQGGPYVGGSNVGGSYVGGSYVGGSYVGGSYTSGSYASGSYASGSYASGSYVGGSYASGSYASGSYASGSYTSGSYAGGSYASGSYVGASYVEPPYMPTSYLGASAAENNYTAEREPSDEDSSSDNELYDVCSHGRCSQAEYVPQQTPQVAYSMQMPSCMSSQPPMQYNYLETLPCPNPVDAPNNGIEFDDDSDSVVLDGDDEHDYHLNDIGDGDVPTDVDNDYEMDEMYVEQFFGNSNNNIGPVYLFVRIRKDQSPVLFTELLNNGNLYDTLTPESKIEDYLRIINWKVEDQRLVRILAILGQARTSHVLNAATRTMNLCDDGKFHLTQEDLQRALASIDDL